MSMKLSYRDKVIIIIVAVLVILGVGVFCFVKPKYEDLKVSQDRLATKQSEEADVKAKMDTLEVLEKRLEDDVKVVEETQKQFINEKEYGETYQISQYLFEKLAPTGITIENITIPALASTDLEAYYYDKLAFAYDMKINGDLNNQLPPEVGYAYTNSYPAAPATVAIAGTEVLISFSCSNDTAVLDAIDTIAQNEENIYLLNCSAGESTDETNPGTVGTMSIMVYELYPMDLESIDE